MLFCFFWCFFFNSVQAVKARFNSKFERYPVLSRFVTNLSHFVITVVAICINSPSQFVIK